MAPRERVDEASVRAVLESFQDQVEAAMPKSGYVPQPLREARDTLAEYRANLRKEEAKGNKERINATARHYFEMAVLVMKDLKSCGWIVHVIFNGIEAVMSSVKTERKSGFWSYVWRAVKAVAAVVTVGLVIYFAAPLLDAAAVWLGKDGASIAGCTISAALRAINNG